MRSTQRSKRIVADVITYVIAVLGAALLVVSIFTRPGRDATNWFYEHAMPAQPNGPRYEAAGNDAPHYGGTFVFHHETNLRSLDPLKEWDELSTMAIRLTYDGLLDFDENANVIPSLAALPDVSEDGRTFTFRLREGVRFHNGRELTAEDVKWSMERMMHPQTGSPGFAFYQVIEGAEPFHRADEGVDSITGIRVLDRYTVEFRLTTADQTFLSVMAMPFAYPVAHENYPEFGREYPPGEAPDARKSVIGTGPFRLVSWERGVELVFRRNDDYWRPRLPYVNRMIFRENMPRGIALMRFRNGDLDAVHRFSPADYLIINQQPGWAPHRLEYPKTNLWGLAMNTQMPPFDDAHVRRAVAFGFNRQRWNRARANRMRITGQPVPPPLMGYDEDLPNRQYYDVDRAREELALAGHPVEVRDGRPNARGIEPVTIWVGDQATGRAYGELAQYDLAQIGIPVTIRQVGFATLLEQTGKPGIAQMLLWGWNADFPDPSNFFDSLWHGRLIQPRDCPNRSFYQNRELDALLDRARGEVDLDRRRVMYVEASDLVARDAPWAFGWNDLWLEAWQPYVRNYRPHPVWSNNYREIWLDEPRRRVVHRDLGLSSSRLAMLGSLRGL